MILKYLSVIKKKTSFQTSLSTWFTQKLCLHEIQEVATTLILPSEERLLP